MPPIPPSLTVNSDLRLKLDSATTTSELKPGQVLEVQVVSGPRGELGIKLNGNFVPATFPPGVGVGDKLTVQVQANPDLLLLKILSVLKEQLLIPKAVKEKFPWSDLLEKLLDGLPLEQRAELRAALSQDKGALSKQLSTVLAQQNPATAEGKPALTSEQVVKQALQQLASQKLVATSEELEQGSLLSKLLIKATERDLQQALVQARSSIKQLEKFVSLSPAAKVLLFVQEQLALLEGSKHNLGFDQAQQGDAAHFKKFLEGVLGKILDPGSADHQALLKSVSKIDSSQNEVGIFMNFLQLFSGRGFIWKDKATAGVLDQLFKSLLGGLHEKREGRASDVEVRTLLSKSRQELGELLKRMNIGVASNSELTAVQSSLKSLDGLLGAKEALTVLNPFFAAMGEPSLYLIPAFANGHFSRWEMSLNPFLIKEEQHRQGQPGEAYQVVELYVPLNSLGPLQVTLAHKSKEVLLKVICAEQNVADYLNGKFSQFEETLRKLGYTHSSLKAVRGEPREISPHWYTEVLRSSIVA